MSVAQLTRFKGGKPEEMIKAAKQAKVLMEKHGAEYFLLNRFHTGNWAGEWLVVTRFPSWAAYGKAQEGLAKDSDYQKLLAHVLGIAEMTGRNLVVGVDL